MRVSRATAIAALAVALHAQRAVNRARGNPSSANANGIRSLTVERIDPAPSGAFVRLHNASSKDLVGYSLTIGSDRFANRVSSTPVVSAGASERIRIQNATISPDSGQLLIRAALFADGSYEGDAAAAASLVIPGMAEGVERRRIVSALEQLISANEPLSFQDVRSRISDLRTQMDVVSVLEIAERFPSVGEITDAMRIQFEQAAGMQKERFLERLEEVEKHWLENLPNGSLPTVSVRDTLIQLANEYARL